jgi:hypothetical protein
MPIYTIRETKPATQVWEYEVEANSAEEAVEKIAQGTAKPVNYYVDSNEFEDFKYDIEESEEN